MKKVNLWEWVNKTYMYLSDLKLHPIQVYICYWHTRSLAVYCSSRQSKEIVAVEGDNKFVIGLIADNKFLIFIIIYFRRYSLLNNFELSDFNHIDCNNIG